MDVKSAFLNGELQETVFISLPPGFKNAHCRNAIYRLKKALYSLKQVPWAWFNRFNSFLFSQWFVSSNADSSLFLLKKGEDIVIFLLYVDGMLITGNSSQLLDIFLVQVSHEFAMKDLGQFHFFLGIKV